MYGSTAAAAQSRKQPLPAKYMDNPPNPQGVKTGYYLAYRLGIRAGGHKAPPQHGYLAFMPSNYPFYSAFCQLSSVFGTIYLVFAHVTTAFAPPAFLQSYNVFQTMATHAAS